MHTRWLAKLLLPILQRWAAKRDPNFMVTRDGGVEIYLKRWWLITRNNYFNIYLHNMLLDDDPILHDHPYWSLSLTLTDGLEEIYRENPDLESYQSIPYSRNIKAGQWVWRGSRFAHQLIVHQPAWTIFITGPRVREWGFWCPKGFIPWHKYVAVNQDPSVNYAGKSAQLVGSGNSTKGRGCGEYS